MKSLEKGTQDKREIMRTYFHKNATIVFKTD